MMEYNEILRVVESYDEKKGLPKITGEPDERAETFGSGDIVQGTTQDKGDEVLDDMLNDMTDEMTEDAMSEDYDEEEYDDEELDDEDDDTELDV